MINLIEVNGYVIGYKEDLINYLNDEVNKARYDETIPNEDLSYILDQTTNAINDLEKYDNLTLLGVGESWNSDFVVKEIGIEF